MQTLTAVFLCLGVLSPIFARELLTKKDIYSKLDVQAALKVARGEVVQPAKEETLEMKPWSIPLVHRDAMKGYSDDNNELSYAERMQKRLKRDAARVGAMNKKLELAVNGVKRSSLRPDSSSSFTTSESDIESPVVSGMDQGSGEYFSRIGVGAPKRDQLMVLDTGSDVSWIQCEPCSDCYQQSDPIYQPSQSSTYQLVSCQDNLCQKLDVSGCSRNESCLYQVSYGDGSYTIGNFATETMSLGGATVPKVAIGCGHDNEGLFVGAAGLLGLGGGSLSFPSQLTDDGKIFSYCLVDRDSESSSTLQFGRAAVPNGAVVAPMLKNSRLDTFYYVSLSGISVGGKMLPISDSVFGIDASGNGGIIVDSGTAVTRLQSAAYDSLRDAFRAGTKDLTSTDGVSLFDTCYDLSSKDSVDVPTVVFHFSGGGSMPLPAKNYLVPVDSMGTFCFAFAPTSSSLSIVGNIQQQGIRVSFDRVNSQVGFAANKC